MQRKMVRFTTGPLLAFGTFLFLLAAHPSIAQQEAEWTWEDSRGNTRTRADLKTILEQHKNWVRSERKSGTRAVLNDADLTGADLTGAILIGANLSGTDLTGTNLSGADLTRAILIRANLTGAQLRFANLTGADLSGANLGEANLTGANLTGADLNGADLTGADLSGASLWEAKLDGAIFEPKALPELWTIATADGLELLIYKDSPGALVQLRKQFQDGGFREQERKITYALKRGEAEGSWAGCKSSKLPGDKTRAILWSPDSRLANCSSFILNRMFFDLTCQYGMSPGRPLSLGALLWLFCSVLYLACIHASGEAGLYRVYAPGIQEDPSTPRRVERVSPRDNVQTQGARRFLQFLLREWLVFRASMFFSLMSAFNIGFRDVNFGRWLRLLTRQEFDIKAAGWARVVAGWQSLISVYLIALWVLTYFGRPFG